MPAASAMSRTVVFLKPFSAKSFAAMCNSSSRRVPAATSGMLAAHRDDLTGHVGGVVAGQEHHHVGHLPRLGSAAERLALLALGEEFGGGHLLQDTVHGQARSEERRAG